MRRALAVSAGQGISIHALLAESDQGCETSYCRVFFISIHALLAESDAQFLLFAQAPSAYFYPRSPCGERPWLTSFPSSPTRISIHALLAESDCRWTSSKTSRQIFLSTLSLRRATSAWRKSARLSLISIHALLAESDIILTVLSIPLIRFLSTLSLRRATHGQKTKGRHSAFLSTLSLRRATRD